MIETGKCKGEQGEICNTEGSTREIRREFAREREYKAEQIEICSREGNTEETRKEYARERGVQGKIDGREGSTKNIRFLSDPETPEIYFFREKTDIINTIFQLCTYIIIR
jgi:hypothetical protein